MKVRPPIVAGQFYPGDKATLEAELKKYMKPQKKIDNAVAIMAPHAGYIYSGKTAGIVYSSVNIPETVFVLSPNHSGMGYPISLHPSESWATPLGTLNSDLETLKKIKDKVPQAQIDETAQLREHALEVQLPFLQMINPNTKLVPITLSHIPFDIIHSVGSAIAETMIDLEKQGQKRPMIVASSDMTHFENTESAKKKDTMAIEKIKGLDTNGLLDVVEKNNISMCGVYPAAVTIEALLHYSKLSGKNKPSVILIDYSTSGDVTGDMSSVVAYAGLIFTLE